MENVIQDVLVLKVGTSTLVTKEDGTEKLDRVSFRRIGRQVIGLEQRGTRVAIVSSAGITAGMMSARLSTRPGKDTGMPQLQRLASIGWRHILNAWADALPGREVGSLLLTKHELDLKAERTEALRTTHCLMVSGDTVVINENDAITHQEIAFGDNDTLAAHFASCLGRSALFGSVRLLLLSDIDGVYADIHDRSSLIHEIDNLDNYRHIARGTMSQNGTGGMATKFSAAEIALQNGIDMFIAHGRQEDVIMRALSGDTGTRFICP